MGGGERLGWKLFHGEAPDAMEPQSDICMTGVFGLSKLVAGFQGSVSGFDVRAGSDSVRSLLYLIGISLLLRQLVFALSGDKVAAIAATIKNKYPDYYLSKFQATLGDFDLFFVVNGKPLFDAKYRKREDLQFRYQPNLPALTQGWQEAKDYCEWVGQLSGYAVDLPTETQ